MNSPIQVHRVSIHIHDHLLTCTFLTAILYPELSVRPISSLTNFPLLKYVWSVRLIDCFCCSGWMWGECPTIRLKIVWIILYLCLGTIVLFVNLWCFWMSCIIEWDLRDLFFVMANMLFYFLRYLLLISWFSMRFGLCCLINLFCFGRWHRF